MIRNTTITLIFNTIQNYKREFQGVLIRHFDNLQLTTEEEREGFSSSASKIFRVALQRLIKVR